jgi:tRNA threonylcarbamoyladenosine biosynthesis protein TsaB
LNILAIDTSCEILSLAIRTEKGVFAYSAKCAAHTSELLCPAIDSLTARAGIEREDIGLFACMRGPGSFTALRSGFAVVKALAFALGARYLSVPTLDCLASGAGGFDGLVLPLLDAKQNRFYCRLYQNGAPRSAELDAGAGEIAEMLAGAARVLLTGAGAPLAFERLRGLPDAAYGGNRPGRLILAHTARAPAAQDLLNFIIQNDMVAAADDELSAPVYLRPAL